MEGLGRFGGSSSADFFSRNSENHLMGQKIKNHGTLYLFYTVHHSAPLAIRIRFDSRMKAERGKLYTMPADEKQMKCELVEHEMTDQRIRSLIPRFYFFKKREITCH